MGREFLCARETSKVSLAERSGLHLGVKFWMRCRGRLSRGGVVEVVRFAVLWAVLHSDESGDEIPEVTCLDDFKWLEFE